MSVANIQLKKRIMRRVYIISVIRRIFHPIVLKSIILAVFVVMGNILVSVPNVINNMPISTNISASFSFIMNALAHTDTLVQMIFLVSVILVVWLIKDALQSFSLFSHNRQLMS